MGEVSLASKTDIGDKILTHEAFELKVERVKFEYANIYSKWKESVQMFGTDGSHIVPMLQNQASNVSVESPLPLPSPRLLN